MALFPTRRPRDTFNTPNFGGVFHTPYNSELDMLTTVGKLYSQATHHKNLNQFEEELSDWWEKDREAFHGHWQNTLAFNATTNTMEKEIEMGEKEANGLPSPST